ncbi:MAG: polyribonucleotide nucleotidyltransferase [Bacteroidales bacterium]|nr:polyribonucleotide nucleotidyltransferase [Bacteroidales bacterium]MCF8328106.1 polyribonucleotide nucleotidyltransferase [Bacteroidales bacterium]
MTKIGIQETFHLGDGASTTLETGKLAKQADGSVVVTHGDTMLLATVVSKKEVNKDVNFLPLTVDYKEKYAAAGRFPGGFFKREARPSEYEILISRLIDRALRPLFPDDYRAETQVLVSLISAGKDISPDAYACLAASAAIQVSDIPIEMPISEVRVAQIDDKFVINPLRSELENATLELIVAGTMENVNMVEGEMQEASEETMMEAIKAAHAAIKVQCQAQIELRKKTENEKGEITIREYEHPEQDEELEKKIWESTYDKAYEIASANITDKHERSEKFSAIIDEFIESMSEEEQEEKASLAKHYFHDVQKDAIRNMVLDKRTRLDGRKLDEIRPIWSEVDYLPAAHGSAVFTRGETQSLSTVTLGSKLDEQVIDGAIIEEKQDFILHYNFPPFSTGEVKRMMGTSRREHGHGNLALRALKPIMPASEDNPYTIRIVSDILESNGSSSMATVCAGTLALMDAGVKIQKPVSGIAMGLIADAKSDNYAVLSDILGDEDHLGDMDFKVTGTRDGITACQMDIKVDGLSYKVMGEALEQAKAGRMHILDKMTETIEKPREDYKDFVPRIESLIIAKEFIGAIIGPGGKVIQEIQNETNTTITIEEVGEFGHIDIMSPDKESIDQAKERIRLLTTVPEVGEVYTGKVKNVVAFGAFVEILPGKEGLLHISELEWHRVNNVEDILKVGDEVQVKLIEVDKRSGKLKLSRKALLPKPEKDK